MNAPPGVLITAERRNVSYSLRSVSRTHVGRVRSINEDRVFDDAGAGVWAIADGMGGHSGGDLAAQQVVDCLREAVAGAARVTPQIVRDALAAANGIVHARNLRLGLDAGATVVSATFAEGFLDIAWAGDSRAYRLRNRHAELLTHDHSVVQQLVDAGLITAASAERHPQANVVTRALGVSANPALDVVRAEARADRFLLCSDGLSRSLHPNDFGHDLALGELADRLVANAMQRDGTDNISLVLIEVSIAQ